MSHATTATDTKKDIEILNRSLGGEYFGIAAYQAAVGTGLLEDGVRAVAEKFQGDHRQHAQRIQEAIVSLGGDPIETKTWEEMASEFPPPPLKTQEDVLHYAVSLERSGAIASVASVAELSSPELSQLAASIAGVEAMHWSALLGALGENPVPVSFIPSPSD
jgi:ferritin-like protein